MEDLLSGGGVGAVTGEMLKYALQTIQNGREFGPTLEMNVETLNALAPLVEQIKYYSDLLGRPIEEIERFETHLREGDELVRKSKKLTRWKFFRFPHYQTKLKKKDEALKRHLNVNVQVENRRDLMEVLAYVKVILEIMMKENLVGGAQIWGLSGNNQIWGLFGAPEEPSTFVGRENTINNLKIELIKGGVSVHVLTGLGGIGKSTLAKKFCWDSQIKGKFCGNIFYVTLTRNSSLKHIVQTLFKHCGLRVPEFHNDEDAFNRLRFLLSQVGRNPILLVLDDVWPDSERLVESLVEMLKFQMLDCKILVTSRVAFTRFGPLFQLDLLHEHDAWSLFHHFAQLNHSSSSHMPDKNLVHEEEVRDCKGSPLASQVNIHEEEVRDCKGSPLASQVNIHEEEVRDCKGSPLASQVNIHEEEVRDCKGSPLASQVNTKEDWTVFFGVVAGLLTLSSVGTSLDFLRFICIGMLIGMAFPVTYMKNVDKINRCMEWLMKKYKRFYEIIDEKAN